MAADTESKKGGGAQAALGLLVLGGMVAGVAAIAYHFMGSKAGAMATKDPAKVVSSPVSNGKNKGDAEHTPSPMPTIDPMSLSSEQIDKAIEMLKRHIAETEGSIAQLENSGYFINAEIKEKDAGDLTLWGQAIAKDGQIEDGSYMEKGNIVIRNANTNNINGAWYTGDAWFIGKSTGKNAFGADVPVHIFGPEPDSLVELRNQHKAMDDLMDRLLAARVAKQSPAERLREAEAQGEAAAKTEEVHSIAS